MNPEIIKLTFTIKVKLSLWDAFKLRLAGCKVGDINDLRKEDSEMEEE